MKVKYTNICFSIKIQLLTLYTCIINSTVHRYSVFYCIPVRITLTNHILKLKVTYENITIQICYVTINCKSNKAFLYKHAILYKHILLSLSFLHVLLFRTN